MEQVVTWEEEEGMIKMLISAERVEKFLTIERVNGAIKVQDITYEFSLEGWKVYKIKKEKKFGDVKDFLWYYQINKKNTEDFDILIKEVM